MFFMSPTIFLRGEVSIMDISQRKELENKK